MQPDVREDWQDEEINLLDYWRVIRKRGRMILGLVLVPALVVGVYTYFFATRIYESRVAILAPRESVGGGSAMAAALLASSGAGQFLGGLGGLLGGGGTNRDTFVAILKSRTMAADLVDLFGLEKYYKAKYRDQSIKMLQDVTDITVSKEGVVAVVVEDKNPRLAADIANAYVTHLDRLFARLGTTDASRQRAFVADRLETTEKVLRRAEEALRHFQEKNKAIVL
ncbi:MAG TPA: Wzz/FepE/Etk N-terminal domain-containing protein, partial [Candidatus Methylomirabilis sp.]|nr:Wzz/FepE/Etk N-terminal domain-containing protein [Candidatus Methylomirabilis sp.]